jgi:hypothetical protein
MATTYTTMSHGCRRLATLFLMLTMLNIGCNTSPKHQSEYNNHISRENSSSYNPFFVFDHPSRFQRIGNNGSVNSEDFVRDRWPANGVGSIVETAEVMSYNQDSYSDEYIDGCNQPIQYYHYRQNSTRQIGGYR